MFAQEQLQVLFYFRTSFLLTSTYRSLGKRRNLFAADGGKL